ncbi:hypothetical protein CXG81DRAFT_16540 [Caulochytrium protostelioides]|uniref:Uncharacterized protein n=1 Tax=Caulochytrium protostelioides TaxID=1555241 RepID=A0A4P9XFN1_9FUNG|nr:hypothetical protein CXG81DRAFT_16540 [Caulochytrium protostelioides]|eukprot:RKP03970.1 hypothetical protein CXG81DRAFT_16540 [Caulochytrium protostelioides]
MVLTMRAGSDVFAELVQSPVAEKPPMAQMPQPASPAPPASPAHLMTSASTLLRRRGMTVGAAHHRFSEGDFGLAADQARLSVSTLRVPSLLSPRASTASFDYPSTPSLALCRSLHASHGGPAFGASFGASFASAVGSPFLSTVGLHASFAASAALAQTTMTTSPTAAAALAAMAAAAPPSSKALSRRSQSMSQVALDSSRALLRRSSGLVLDLMPATLQRTLSFSPGSEEHGKVLLASTVGAAMVLGIVRNMLS